MGIEDTYVDLSQLLGYVKDMVSEAFPVPVWVKAEISSFSPRANGHCYLTLSESRGGKIVAESRAMIWSWKYLQLKQYFEQESGSKLEAGITVLVKVKVNYSELYGVSLYVEDIDPAFTAGERALEKKRIIERLTNNGYMELQKELALPRLPYRLAVITSKTAAGYQDFRRHLLENEEGYVFDPVLFEASMQGETAARSICSSIEEAVSGDFDAILILRGGGSETDLACFDDEALAVAIASAPVPVITAIGHDKDVHIADMVANLSVKTPTALADIFLDIYREEDSIIDAAEHAIKGGLSRRVSSLELGLGDLDGRLKRAVRGRIQALEADFQRCAARISRGLLSKYSVLERIKDAVAHRIKFGAQSKLSQAISQVALKEALIKASDPRNILSMGYVLVTGKDNKILKTVDRVAPGDRIGVRFTDGSLTAKVDEVFSQEDKNTKTSIA